MSLARRDMVPHAVIRSTHLRLGEFESHAARREKHRVPELAPIPDSDGRSAPGSVTTTGIHRERMDLYRLSDLLSQEDSRDRPLVAQSSRS